MVHLVFNTIIQGTTQELFDIIIQALEKAKHRAKLKKYLLSEQIHELITYKIEI